MGSQIFILFFYFIANIYIKISILNIKFYI